MSTKTKKLLATALTLAAIFFVAGEGMGKGVPPLHKEKLALLRPDQLGAEMQMVVTAVSLAQQGDLKGFPFIAVLPGANVSVAENLDPKDASLLSVWITDQQRFADGSAIAGMILQWMDQLGRRMFTAAQIAYRTRPLNPRDIKAIKETLKGLGYYPGQIDQNWDQSLSEAIASFQRAKGISPTGGLDALTLKALDRISPPIIEITDLSVIPLYPRSPTHLLYIVPESVVKKHPERFKGGFKSLKEVIKHAIPAKDLTIQGGNQKYVVFVFFLDRVNPTYPIRVNFSGYAGEWSDFFSDKFFADPKGWPVVVQTLTVREVMVSSSLWMNVWVNRKCIASYKLL